MTPKQVAIVGQTAHIRWRWEYSEAVFLGDKTCVKALAQHDSAQIAMARKLCYIDDDMIDGPRGMQAQSALVKIGVNEMCWEHEVVHSLLAEARGLDVSPTLWAVAHDMPACGTHEQWSEWNREEDEVFALQTYLNTNDHNVDPKGLLAALSMEFDLAAFRTRALEVLRARA